MNDNYTDITFVLDRSGSMQSIWDDVKGGFKTLIKDQKEVRDQCHFTLYAFDHEYEKVLESPLSDVVKIPSKIQPRGMTALLDAVGRAINETGVRLSQMQEKDRPGKVVFIIQTDGYENASQEFTLDQVKQMVQHQTNDYNWEFLFLGADMDSIGIADSLGIFASNSLNYTSSKIGVDKLYQGISTKLRGYRTGDFSNMAFSDEEKETTET